MKQCVILVGGKGTRLGDLTKNMPKPMVEIDGSPFLLKLLDIVQRYGFQEILLLASHANEVIFNYFKDFKYKGCNIKIIVEQEPLGTGGAIINAYDSLEEIFFCLNGDSLIDGNWLRLNQYLDEECNSVIALSEISESSRYGSVTLDNGFISNFNEKSEQVKSNLINAGIYLFKKEVFKNFTKGNKSLEKDIIPVIVERNQVKGVLIDGYFIDIGTPESLDEAKNRVWNNKNKKAIIFDRDGTLNEDDGYTHKVADLKWKDGAIELIKYLNDKNYYVFVATNQAGIAKGKFNENDMKKFHNNMQKVLIESGAHIDKFYFCPYHVDAISEKYKKDSSDRKPKTGMLEKIKKEWNLSKENMYLIGDRDTDIKCADNFKIKSLLYNGKDNLLNIFLENFDE